MLKILIKWTNTKEFIIWGVHDPKGLRYFYKTNVTVKSKTVKL